MILSAFLFCSNNSSFVFNLHNIFMDLFEKSNGVWKSYHAVLNWSQIII